MKDEKLTAENIVIVCVIVLGFLGTLGLLTGLVEVVF